MTGDLCTVNVDGVDLSRSGRRLLDGVSLHAGPGDLVALVGPNGAGKSTLLRVLSGDLTADAGSVSVGGHDAATWKPQNAARHRAVMSQNHAVSFSFTVREVVEMGRVPHPVSDGDTAIVEDALRRSDIVSLHDRDVTTLSGGELARTVFARVLAQTPGVVFLDEPTAPLDLRHQEVVMRTLAELASRGCCVIVVLHDLNLAARYANRVSMFRDGRIVVDDSPEQVFTADRIREVYGQEVRILRHPVSGDPMVVPV